MKRRLFAALMCALPVLGWAAYPEKPVRLVVPFTPGSITDVVARALAQGLDREFGQSVVVENRAGANGTVGTASAIRSEPDGYTLFMVGVSTGASNVSAFKSLPYDPRKDFAPIGLVAEAPFMLVSRGDLPVNSVKDLIDYAKANPGKLSYGYGSGSAQLCGAQVVSMGGFTATAVAYRGVPQVMTDLMGGVLDFTVADMVNGLQQSRAGRVKALGVTSKTRSPLAPELPTLAEAGLPDYDLNVWFGVAAPAGTPADVVARINTALGNVLSSPSVQQQFATNGLTVRTSTPDGFRQLIASDIDKWGKVFADAGLTPQ
ncbi:Bug family tripartite tricarboxylate transporter substrate binding protein [Bordetella genomosp. 4]|uniref:ABC transporter substrate-binding protein n=1 Tax=Bordetella genomosp. 4 TaxID=463044 RepID=A0A261U6H6_9BORD|nr:tripartite tricarboxylate transporter substrate binding protein [Bordetella genomosp. 4]OZI51353.1 ABC transporter substrate-binding protein [Bordetella genomosp. 4]OZI57538.1 ABC transporter substrate-binding protein [Bordetella genomosp. 4]